MIKTWIKFFIAIGKYSVTEILSRTKLLFAFYFAKNLFGDYCWKYLKSLNWIVLLGIAAFCIALAAVNNIRLGDPKAENAKSVEWIGTQDVMEKPAEVL